MCTSVIRVSSWVSRSNLRTILSISLSPNSFFANCSVTSSVSVTYIHVKEHLLNLPCLTSFFAWATIESISAIILTIISIIEGLKEILE